ncbi:MAG: translocation/assembly module TamB domain-containing protein, partial [Cyanobacteria bacterium P01_C01_bin.72]
NLDVAQTNLDIVANLDFARLPINQIVASATQNNELIAQSVNIDGKANFKGQFSGQQLLSAPGEKISLVGDVNLTDFAFNNIAFDPVMTGSLNLQPQQELALQLQGEQDIIAARAVPCRTADCKLPYLPTNLELRQGEDTEQPVIALGERNGDRFALDIDNFPLALLNLAPGRAAGIEGALDGTATGAVDLNLSTLAAAGNIAVDNPGLGYIQADRFNADFDYDPDQNIAAINSASLELNRSQYDLNAALDLATGKIDGKLNIPQAYIQDLLQTLRWFTIEDVVSLFKTPEYGAVDTVQPDPIKDVVDFSLARKLDQLRQVNNQIQANAAAREAAGVPTELDIQGQYTGEVIFGGTIQVPEADFRVEGNNWQWQPNPAFADIVNPLGLIIEESQFIALPKLLIDGNLQGTTVDLAEARIEVQEAALSLKGKLDPQQADASFEVANLTVDNISKFVEIPVDLAGEFNSVGKIQGTLEQPKLQGEVTFSDGAFNGNVLPEELAGDFSYNGSQLYFQTTTPQSIQVEATVPYPIIPGSSDRLTAKANLESEAFVFLAALSQNYLNWAGGGGDAELEATGRLDLEREGVLYDLAAEGVVNLDQANVLVETPFFSEIFVGTGKITLENQIINVETLDATFADKDLSVTGKLPILTPVSGLDNPLNIKLPPGEIDIDKLYKGGIEGQVLITGASLEPVIGGEVTLEDGIISIPQAQTPTTKDAVKIVKAQVTDTVSGASSIPQRGSSPNQSSGFVTTLNDFQVNLLNFKLRQTPLYNFQLAGGLNLNGTLDQPSNIIPQGKLELTRADVDLFSTRFNLARDRDNTIIFTPEAGVLNPSLDIVLRTAVEDVDTGQVTTFRSVETSANEIEDPVSDNDNSNTIRIRLTVDGEAAEILPSLGNSASSGCNIRSSSQPLVENEQYYTEAELNRYTKCFADSFSISSSDRNLIDSTAVSLTSTPSLNRGEIIGLLSNQFIGFAEELSTRSQSELFDLGVERFVLNPLFDRALYRVEDTTVAWGRKIGLDYLTIYPDLEGIYELDQNSSLRLTFTHNLLSDVVEVINDSDDDLDTSSNEIRLEYQRSF